MANETLDDILSKAGLELVAAAIGRGGSAVVHKCKVVRAAEGMPSVGEFVAVKQYSQEILDAPNQLDRIRQEATAGARLRHANLVRTYALIEEPLHDGSLGRVLLILEWVDGATLQAWFDKQLKPIPWERILVIGTGLIDGLEALHAAGLYHRDIKPDNVMVRESGEPVLMDIGVAELTGNDEHSLHTSVREFIGSVRFSSPQFLSGDQFDAADDMYSLAATLYLLFTGKLVYSEIERKPLIAVAVATRSPSVDSLLEDVPPSMRVLLQGALHRVRARRPNCRQFRDSIANPETADYITQELAAQQTDARSYPIIQAHSDGTSFFADLNGDAPALDEDYTVVRLGRSVFVPSLNREVALETWIAAAVLKHVHQGVGNFAVSYRRWKSNTSFLANNMYSAGNWVDELGTSFKVQKGDLVLRRTPS